MKNLALLTLCLLSVPALAQPADPLRPVFKSVKADGGTFGAIAAPYAKIDVLDAGTGDFQGKLSAAGPIVSGSTVTGTGVTANSSNGFTASGSGIFQTTASNTSFQTYGNANDGAAAIANKIASNVSLTAGTDRYISVFYNDAATTARARVFTDGTYQNLATSGTSASGTGITALNSLVRHFVHKVSVTNAAMAAASTTDVTLHVTPVNTRIIRVLANVTQTFTGGSLSAVTVTCGSSAGGNQYLLSGSVFTATTTLGDVLAEMGAGVVSSTLADFGTVASGVPGAITVQCRFTCTSANCSAATQGNVNFYVEGVTYP